MSKCFSVIFVELKWIKLKMWKNQSKVNFMKNLEFSFHNPCRI